MSTGYDNEGAGLGAGASRDTASGGAESLNFGSARSDYGDRAYGGTLNRDATSGASADSFAESGSDRGGGGRREPRGEGQRGTQGGREVGNSALMLLVGMGLGAALMYVLDPERGRRRRALLRDKMIAATNDANRALGKTARDLRNRAQGVVAEAGGALASVGNLVGGAGRSGEQEQSGDESPRANAATGGGASV